MHKYLRAIGFSRITKAELDALLSDIRRSPDSYDTALASDGSEFTELRREIAPGLGIAMRGSYNDYGGFDTEYYFPYVKGREISSKVPAEIVLASDRESYLGMCDDIRLGVDLIFYIQDIMTILSSEQRNKRTVDFGGNVLAGLSTEGKVLIPLHPSMLSTPTTASKKREELMMAARDGDNDAFEQLTLDDMDTYAIISHRVENEDIMTIVETYFMPSGIESDKYAILADILEVKNVVNHKSAEILHVMKVRCNNLIFDVCINSKDLIGEPMPGRRFKGSIWMQGRVKAV